MPDEIPEFKPLPAPASPEPLPAPRQSEPPPPFPKPRTITEAFEAIGAKKIPPMAKKSPIVKAYQLPNNQVMVITEDGNRRWFTPGEPHGDEELQDEYRTFKGKSTT